MAWPPGSTQACEGSGHRRREMVCFPASAGPGAPAVVLGERRFVTLTRCALPSVSPGRAGGRRTAHGRMVGARGASARGWGEGTRSAPWRWRLGGGGVGGTGERRPAGGPAWAAVQPCRSLRYEATGRSALPGHRCRRTEKSPRRRDRSAERPARPPPWPVPLQRGTVGVPRRGTAAPRALAGAQARRGGGAILPGRARAVRMRRSGTRPRRFGMPTARRLDAAQSRRIDHGAAEAGDAVIAARLRAQGSCLALRRAGTLTWSRHSRARPPAPGTGPRPRRQRGRC